MDRLRAERRENGPPNTSYYSELPIKLARMDTFNTLLSATYILLMFLQFDVLPAFGPTILVSHPAYPQPDDVASRSVALQSSGCGLDYHILLEGAAVVVFGLICLALLSAPSIARTNSQATHAREQRLTRQGRVEAERPPMRVQQ